MTLYDGMILTFILIGIIIIIVSFLFSKYDYFIEEEENKKHLKRMDDRIDYDEVRNKILELNEYGEYLKDELEKKHKELLFLYQMILEKQKELKINDLGKQVDMNKVEVNKSNSDKLIEAPVLNEEGLVKRTKENKINCNSEILNLSLAGYKTCEIAKKLKIGQGQVELVLNLYK